jgi:hypothetical protein
MLLSTSVTFAGQMTCQVQGKTAGFDKVRLLTTSERGFIRLQFVGLDGRVVNKKLTKITNSIFTNDEVTAELKRNSHGAAELEITRYKTGNLFLTGIGCTK